MTRFAALAFATLLAACAQDRPPEIVQAPAYCPVVPAIPVNEQGLVLPPPAITAGANDWESAFAYNLEQSLASPSRLAGRPADTARGLAQVELLANSWQRNLRFQTFPPIVTVQMRQGSEALRSTMGVGSEVSSAQFAGTLFQVECALRAGDRPTAQRLLARVAQAPDALDLIAPPGGTATPRIPGATQVAASLGAKAIRSQAGSFLRISRL